MMNRNFAAVADLINEVRNDQKHQAKEREELNLFFDSQTQTLEELPGDPKWKEALSAVKPLLDLFNVVGLRTVIHRPYLYAHDPASVRIQGHNFIRDTGGTFSSSGSEMTPECALWNDDKKEKFPLQARDLLLDVLRVDMGNSQDVSSALSHYAVKEKKAPYTRGDVNFGLYEPLWPQIVAVSHMHGSYFKSPEVPYFHVALGCNSVSETETSANGWIASKAALSGGEFFKSGLRTDPNCPLHYAFNRWSGFTRGLASAALAIVDPARRDDLLQGLKELGQNNKAEPAHKL